MATPPKTIGNPRTLALVAQVDRFTSANVLLVRYKKECVQLVISVNGRAWSHTVSVEPDQSALDHLQLFYAPDRLAKAMGAGNNMIVTNSRIRSHEESWFIRVCRAVVNAVSRVNEKDFK